MHHPAIFAALAAGLASIPLAHAGMYAKSSPVLQVDARNWDSIIAKSNYTSIVEFYAPWCGHCQNLKPAYEKAAKNLEGLAKVAAVDCDQDDNKQFCSGHGIQGFPTLKIVRPGKKPGRPMIEDYRGPRTALGITEEVVNKINNHVIRLSDNDIDKFLSNEGPKAILFTDKGTTSGLLRGIAIDFLDVIKIGQIRNKEKKAVEQYGISKFPTLVLFPADKDAQPIVYDGDVKKQKMVEFLKQAGEPNPDPAPGKGKAEKKQQQKTKKKNPNNKNAEKQDPSRDSTTGKNEDIKLKEDATKSNQEEPVQPSEKNAPITVQPTAITSYNQLAENCLQPRSHTCLLLNLPNDSTETSEKAIQSVTELNTKYTHGKRHIFPFFSLKAHVDRSSELRSALNLGSDVELVAMNARRGWVRQYSGDFSVESVEAWIDSIRMGEGKKGVFPKELMIAAEMQSAPSSEKGGETVRETEVHSEGETVSGRREEENGHDEL